MGQERSSCPMWCCWTLECPGETDPGRNGSRAKRIPGETDPGRNGFEAAKDLRKRFGKTYPVLVAVTASSGLSNKCQARVFGFDHYVVKPYNPTSLLQLVLTAKAQG
jgi:hypothetical protein